MVREGGQQLRFKEMSDYDMTHCRLMKKDYSYVLKHGLDLYDNAPDERRSHLARIISESYLAKGDTEKAKEFYDRIGKSDKDTAPRRSLLRRIGSFYATGEFKGAIDNFSMMRDRTDSLGQIANYQLAYSYIKTGNKVAALDASRTLPKGHTTLTSRRTPISTTPSCHST